MLKFYVVKREEYGHSKEFEGEMEFDTLQEFIKYADYHRNYIEEIWTLDGDE